MGILDKFKLKIAEKATENLATKADRGELGLTIQKVYQATKGYKTTIGAALFIVTMAVSQYAPPWADEYTRLSALAFLALGWLGFVDKARRNEPIFEPWLLQGLANGSAWLTAVSAALLGVAQSGVLKLLLPNDPCAGDTLTLVSVAAGSIATFLNRVLKASAAQPEAA